MRHLKKGKKFGRKTDARKALLKGLVASLILKEKIQTTTSRAKQTRILAERLITIAKKQNLAALRFLKSRLPKKAADKLYYQIAIKFKDRKGGYTRLMKSPKRRLKDAGEVSYLELVK